MIKEFRKDQKIWFANEKRPYKVRAFNERYAICTKPFNLRQTIFYSIIDIKENVRSTENLVFGYGFETDMECEEALERLIKGVSELSRRNKIELDVLKFN